MNRYLKMSLAVISLMVCIYADVTISSILIEIPGIAFVGSLVAFVAGFLTIYGIITTLMPENYKPMNKWLTTGVWGVNVICVLVTAIIAWTSKSYTSAVVMTLFALIGGYTLYKLIKNFEVDKRDFDMLADNFAKSREQLLQAKDTNDNLQNELGSCRIQLTNKSDKIAEQSKELAQLRTDYDTCQAKIKQLESSNAELTDNALSWKKLFEDKSEEFNGVQKLLRIEQDNAKKLERELGDSDEALRSANQELAELKPKYEAMLVAEQKRASKNAARRAKSKTVKSE